ncbi:MAG: hypothetical protein Q4G58_17990 [bacterium]|nr:hypothetical protein [bacterium]
MKKKSKVIGISIGLCTVILVGCNGDTKQKETSIKPAISATMASERVAEPEKTIAVTATPMPTTTTTSYSKALTPEELKNVEQLARTYYKKESSFKLLSIQTVEDDSELYDSNNEYQPGNIIIFKVETSHAGKGVYRYITYGRKSLDNEFELLGEGY